MIGLTPPHTLSTLCPCLQAVVDLARVRAIVLLHTQHVNETRTFEFLSAASRGDEVTVRKVSAPLVP